MPRKKTTESKTTPEKKSVPEISVFHPGDIVFIKGGATDIEGRSISAIYAGQDCPVEVISQTGNVVIVCSNGVIIAAIDADNISRVPIPTKSVAFIVGRSRVEILSEAVWWGTTIAVPANLTAKPLYLQALDESIGKATVGTHPQIDSSTTVGTVSLEFLRLV